MSKRAQKKETNLSPQTSSISLIAFTLGIVQFVCPLLFFTNLTRNPYYTQISLLNLLIVAVVIIWAAKSFTRKEINFPRIPIELPLYSFLVVALISSILSWQTHPEVRPGIAFETTRVWSFTLVNCVMALYLPLLFVPATQVEKIRFTIWSDLVVSLIWSMLWIPFHTMKDPDTTLLIWDPYGAFLWAAALIYVWVRTRRGTTDGFMHVIFSVSTVASLYGLSQYAGRDFIWMGTVTPYGGRPVSTFGNPNFLSSYVMMVAPLAVAYMLMADKKHKKGYAIVAGLCVLSTLSTLTRSSYIGLMAAFFIFGLLLKSFSAQFFKRLSLAVLIVVGLILIFPKTPVKGSQSPIQRFTEVLSAAKTGETYGPWHQRILIWSSAMDMVKENPILGKGWGCFELFYPFYQGRHLFQPKLVTFRTHANNAHNILLEFLAQVGILGTGLAIWIFVAILIFGWRQIRAETDEGRKVWLAALLSSLVGMVVDNFFGNVSIFFSMPAFLFWWLTGTLFKESYPSSAPRAQSVASRLILVVIAFVAAANGIYFVKRWTQEYYYFEGFKFSRANLVTQSVQSLEKAFAAFPGEVNTNYELGNSYAREAKSMADKNLPDEAHKYIEKSLKAYQAAIDANPGYDEIYFNLGVTQLQMGREKEAIKNLETTLYINPLLPSAYGALGNYYLKNQKYDDAIRIFEQGTSLFPKEKDYWNNLGFAYGQLNQKEKAFECFKKAFMLDPGFKSAGQNLASIATDLKKSDPVLEVPSLIDGMQKALARQDYKTAKSKAQKLKELLPDSPDAALSLANCRFYAGEIDSSIAEYKRALSLRPNFPIAHMNLGLLYKSQRRFADARAEFQEVLNLTPEDKEARKELEALPAQP